MLIELFNLEEKEEQGLPLSDEEKTLASKLDGLAKLPAEELHSIPARDIYEYLGREEINVTPRLEHPPMRSLTEAASDDAEHAAFQETVFDALKKAGANEIILPEPLGRFDGVRCAIPTLCPDDVIRPCVLIKGHDGERCDGGVR